jgi:hypothetical protein
MLLRKNFACMFRGELIVASLRGLDCIDSDLPHGSRADRVRSSAVLAAEPQNFGDFAISRGQQHRAIGALTIDMSSRVPSRRLGQSGKTHRCIYLPA